MVDSVLLRSIRRALALPLVILFGSGCEKDVTGPGALVREGASREAFRQAVFTAAVDQLRAAFDLPALGVAVFDSHRVLLLATVGFRSSRSSTPVSPNDPFMIASCTKAMTATLAARLVDQGRIHWDSQLGDFIANVVPNPPARGTVTIEQLLAHRGGAPATTPPYLIHILRQDARAIVDQRRWLTTLFLQIPLDGNDSRPLSNSYVYSNYGYAVAGAALEMATGQSWESLLRDEVFLPLEMTTCGFGPPGTPGRLDAPLGHVFAGSELHPVEPNPTTGNPEALGPSGSVFCGLRDWVKFLMLHLGGAREDVHRYLSDSSWAHLHEAQGGTRIGYALGWRVKKAHGVPGVVFIHSGNNTMFHATAWLAPTEDLGVAVVTNRGDDAARRACDSAITLAAGVATGIKAEAVTAP
jgi:CubicO group peptidase (beta-lactamase class C family)